MCSRFFLLAALSLVACSGYDYHAYRQVGGCWSCGDTLEFSFRPIDDKPARVVELFIGVRSSASYPYKDIWVAVETMSGGNDSIWCRDTVCCRLYGEDGRRNGSTVGILYGNEFFVDTVRVSSHCDNRFRVFHIMSDTLLSGVYDIGVRLAPLGRHLCGEN